MRRSRSLALALLIAASAAAPPAPASAAPDGAALVAAAASADRALRDDEKKLRFRHNITRVIAKWAAAKKAATGADQRRAAEGEAEAWALLAHWSGRADDAKTAAELKAALAEREKPDAEPKKKYWLAKVDVERTDARVVIGFDLDEAPKLRRGVVEGDQADVVRVYFDVTPAIASPASTEALDFGVPEIRAARVAQFDAKTARLVVDVDAKHADRLVADGARVVFERPVAIATKTASEPEPVVESEPEVDEDDPRTELKRLEVALRALTDDDKEDVLAKIVKDTRASFPDVEVEEEEEEEEEAPKVAERVAAKLAEEAPEKEVAKAADAVTPKTDLKRSTRLAARPRASSLLAVRRIVIDPGHGGKDHGASGPGHVKEKDVNLAISRRLAKALKKKLGVEVVLTRDKDEYISLERRSRIANRSGADLFVSIHANANRNKKVHGIETYHLNVTSNRYAKRLARRENLLEKGAGDVPEPEPQEEESIEELIPDGKAGQDLRLILADLAMRSATIESRRLAGYVQSSLVGRLRRDYEDVKDLGVKHALFYVLLGARMPAVLIETGFVSSPMESKRLAGATYQDKVADAIASGIERFILERQRLAQGGVASL